MYTGYICLWDQFPEDYCDPLVRSCSLGFSCSFKFCIAVFTFKVAITSSSLYWLPLGEKYLPSALLGILNLSRTFQGYVCSLLLAPACCIILKLVCLLLILQHMRPGADSFPSAFSRVVLKLKFVIPLWPKSLRCHSVCVHWLSAKSCSYLHCQLCTQEPAIG